MTKKWLALLALMMVPLASSHASPQPLDNEVQLLADDVQDAYAYYDGFDIQDVYVRDYYQRDTGTHGLAFRFILFGGPGAVPIASSYDFELTVGAGGTDHAFTTSTTDGSSWTGSLEYLEGELEAPDDAPFGLAGAVQFFVPHSALGINIGDSVGPFALSHTVDGDLRDIVPGGHPIPGTNGAAEVEGSAAQSRAVTDTFLVDGPDGYTRTELTSQDNVHTMKVQNLITVIGQHVLLEFENETGWAIEKIDTNPKVIEPGEHPEFLFSAVPSETAGTLLLRVASDLGGMEAFEIHPPHHEEEHEHDDEPAAEEEPGKDSPVPILIPLAALLIALRRQQ